MSTHVVLFFALCVCTGWPAIVTQRACDGYSVQSNHITLHLSSLTRSGTMDGVTGCYRPNATWDGYVQHFLVVSHARSNPTFAPPAAASEHFPRLFVYEKNWWIGVPGVEAYFKGSCFTLNGSLPATFKSWGNISDTVTVTGNRRYPVETCDQPKKDCHCPACTAIYGAAGCPDLFSVKPDLVRPNMTNSTPHPGEFVRAVHPAYAHTKAYHGLYLPKDWVNGSQKYPLIVEYMGNGPWTDGEVCLSP